MNSIKKIVSLMLCFLSVMLANAQQAPYGVKGTVVDLESYKPLVGATISIANSKLATTTNEKGEFFISLPADKSQDYLIRATLIGYDAQELTFNLNNQDTEFLSFALKNADAVIEEIVITRRREKATELALLEERKKSNLMLESIGTQELSRKGISDARAALTKMAGVSRQEGVRNVLVRGLGDRFNSTSLNGMPLPSEDPLYKNISLDFFSSDVIQSINVNKTFNPMIGGDVAGANIDIYTKEATGNSFEIGTSIGSNTQTVGVDGFKRIDGANWYGGNLGGWKPPVNDLKNYSFQNTWSPANQNYLLNNGLKFQGSRRFMVGNNPLSLFVMGSMDGKYRYAEGKYQQANSDGIKYLDKEFVQNEYNVSQSAMLNLRYAWANNYISYNSLFIHDQVQNYSEIYGRGNNEEEGDREFTRRQQVNDNYLFVNQLLSKLTLAERWTTDLGLAFNYSLGNEPDRRINNLLERRSVLSFSTNSAGENERFYSDMKDRGIVSKAILNYNFSNDSELERKIDFGYQGNMIKRNFYSTVFNHKLLPPPPSSVEVAKLDEFFNQNNLGTGFSLETGRGTGTAAFNPFYYTGTKNVHSFLASATYQFNKDLVAVLGLRYENIKQEVLYDTNLGTSNVEGPSLVKKNFILPSVNLKYNLSDKMILRASGSQSYIMPQFIEVANMLYTGQNLSTIGNVKVVPSEVINGDIKWELYPNMGELLSFAVFYKHIKNPISRVQSLSSGGQMTFANTGSMASVYGAEVEMKKDLFKTSNSYGENVLSAGLNVSYLYSKQKLDDPIGRYTYSDDKLEGASPLLINADFSYKALFNNFDLTPTVVFNYFSDRIYSIGVGGFENIVEKGVPSLDFVLNGTIKKKIGINLKAENILNPNREYTRAFSNGATPIIVEQYRRGVDLSLGLSYKF